MGVVQWLLGGGTPWGGCRPPAGPLYRYPLIAGVALQSRHQCWMFFCQARLYIYIYMEGRLSSVSSVFNQHILKYFLHHICKGTMRFRAPMKTLSILYMAWRNLQWYLILNIRPRFEIKFELEKDVYSKSKVCWWYLILNIRPIKLGDQHGVFFFRRKVGDEFYITPMQPIELNSKKKSP